MTPRKKRPAPAVRPDFQARWVTAWTYAEAAAWSGYSIAYLHTMASRLGHPWRGTVNCRGKYVLDRAKFEAWAQDRALAAR